MKLNYKIIFHFLGLLLLFNGGFILKNGLVPTKVNGNTYNFPKTMMDAVKTSADAGIVFIYGVVLVSGKTKPWE